MFNLGKSAKLKKRELQVKNLNSLVDLQSLDGTWNHNEYTRGIANGLLLAKYCFNSGEPKFFQRKDVVNPVSEISKAVKIKVLSGVVSSGFDHGDQVFQRLCESMDLRIGSDEYLDIMEVVSNEVPPE